MPPSELGQRNLLLPVLGLVVVRVVVRGMGEIPFCLV